MTTTLCVEITVSTLSSIRCFIPNRPKVLPLPAKIARVRSARPTATEPHPLGKNLTRVSDGSVGVGAEMALEATYQAQINKWLSIQPDLQFIINPGGNEDLGNAVVIGGRISITF